MKNVTFVPAALLAFGALLFAAGCAQPTIAGSHINTSRRAAQNFVLSVTLPDGSQPTAEQWATVKSSFETQLAAAGYNLVDDISLADEIIRVVFTPSLSDPANGTATVVSVLPNTAYAFNRTTFPAYGYASSFYGTPYNSALIGYSAFDNYYNYSNPVVIVPRDNDSHRHHRPNQPDDCPPGTTRGDNHYAHNGDRVHRGPAPGASGGGATRGGRTWQNRLDTGGSDTYARSDSTSHSRPGSSSYSRSEPSSSRYVGPSSSYSRASNSLPSASFSSGSSSFSSGSSSFSSPSYSSPSSSFSSGSSDSGSFSSGGSSSSSYSPPSSGSNDAGATNRNAN